MQKGEQGCLVCSGACVLTADSVGSILEHWRQVQRTVACHRKGDRVVLTGILSAYLNLFTEILKIG